MDGEDRSRLESFRQLKKEIRRSEGHLIVGIDVAKYKHHSFFGTATGKTLLKRLVLTNDAAKAIEKDLEGGKEFHWMPSW